MGCGLFTVTVCDHRAGARPQGEEDDLPREGILAAAPSSRRGSTADVPSPPGGWLPGCTGAPLGEDKRACESAACSGNTGTEGCRRGTALAELPRHANPGAAPAPPAGRAQAAQSCTKRSSVRGPGRAATAAQRAATPGRSTLRAPAASRRVDATSPAAAQPTALQSLAGVGSHVRRARTEGDASGRQRKPNGRPQLLNVLLNELGLPAHSGLAEASPPLIEIATIRTAQATAEGGGNLADQLGSIAARGSEPCRTAARRRCSTHQEPQRARQPARGWCSL